VRPVQTTKLLKIYRIATAGLLALLAVMPWIFRANVIFATVATAVIAAFLTMIAFQVQRLHLLERTVAKLDQLLALLRETKRALSPAESKRLQLELEQIRASLLHNRAMKSRARDAR
jgi:hypothetical protein